MPPASCLRHSSTARSGKVSEVAPLRALCRCARKAQAPGERRRAACAETGIRVSASERACAGDEQQRACGDGDDEQSPLLHGRSTVTVKRSLPPTGTGRTFALVDQGSVTRRSRTQRVCSGSEATGSLVHGLSASVPVGAPVRTA